MSNPRASLAHPVHLNEVGSSYRYRPIPFLRWLAAIFAALVTARIAYDPRIVGDAVGTTPILNWLLWGYGLPALSFWAASVFPRGSVKIPRVWSLETPPPDDRRQRR
ncbi:putative membrane protein [Bradyrhizobium liaoningense]